MYPTKELDKGMKVEKEHTNDPSIAKQIAKAHLYENPHYYEELAKLENM